MNHKKTSHHHNTRQPCGMMQRILTSDMYYIAPDGNEMARADIVLFYMYPSPL